MDSTSIVVWGVLIGVAITALIGILARYGKNKTVEEMRLEISGLKARLSSAEFTCKKANDRCSVLSRKNDDLEILVLELEKMLSLPTTTVNRLQYSRDMLSSESAGIIRHVVPHTRRYREGESGRRARFQATPTTEGSDTGMLMGYMAVQDPLFSDPSPVPYSSSKPVSSPSRCDDDAPSRSDSASSSDSSSPSD